MIFLIHGKNNLQTRERIRKIRSDLKPDEIIELELEDLTATEFANATATPNMFGYKNLLIANEGKTSKKDLLSFIKIAKEKPEKTIIIFTVNKNLRSNSKIIKEIKEAEKYKIVKVTEKKDSTIFNFLDAAFNKDRKLTYKLLKNLREKEEPAFKTHSMLIYQLRNVARTKFNAKVSAPPFVQRKLKKQAENFEEKDILNLFEHFYKTDRDMKLSLIPENLLNVLNVEEILKDNDV